VRDGIALQPLPAQHCLPHKDHSSLLPGQRKAKSVSQFICQCAQVRQVFVHQTVQRHREHRVPRLTRFLVTSGVAATAGLAGRGAAQPAASCTASQCGAPLARSGSVSSPPPRKQLPPAAGEGLGEGLGQGSAAAAAALLRGGPRAGAAALPAALRAGALGAWAPGACALAAQPRCAALEEAHALAFAGLAAGGTQNLAAQGTPLVADHASVSPPGKRSRGPLQEPGAGPGEAPPLSCAYLGAHARTPELTVGLAAGAGGSAAAQPSPAAAPVTPVAIGAASPAGSGASEVRAMPIPMLPHTSDCQVLLSKAGTLAWRLRCTASLEYEGMS
jgi:hypothetical protein